MEGEGAVSDPPISSQTASFAQETLFQSNPSENAPQSGCGGIPVELICFVENTKGRKVGDTGGQTATIHPRTSGMHESIQLYRTGSPNCNV